MIFFFTFCSLIFNPWETFFLPQQIKEGWVRCQGPDQLSQAAISTVLSLWHTRKIWALSKAEGAISKPSKLFSSILLYRYLPLLIFFSPAIIPLLYLTFPSIFPPFSHPLIQCHSILSFILPFYALSIVHYKSIVLSSVFLFYISPFSYSWCSPWSLSHTAGMKNKIVFPIPS